MNTVGTVEGDKTVTHRVNVTAMLNQEIGDNDEIVITVNGRPIKRMNRWQAERMGIIPPRY